MDSSEGPPPPKRTKLTTTITRFFGKQGGGEGPPPPPPVVVEVVDRTGGRAQHKTTKYRCVESWFVVWVDGIWGVRVVSRRRSDPHTNHSNPHPPDPVPAPAAHGIGLSRRRSIHTNHNPIPHPPPTPHIPRHSVRDNADLQQQLPYLARVLAIVPNFLPEPTAETLLKELLVDVEANWRPEKVRVGSFCLYGC